MAHAIWIQNILTYHYDLPKMSHLLATERTGRTLTETVHFPEIDLQENWSSFKTAPVLIL